jgi:Cft2 family RNA processing exonuclease
MIRTRPTLRPVSGADGKGPACFLVETGAARLLLDLGYGPQPGLWPDVSGVGRVDALLLSHGHRDHAGGLKLLDQVGAPRVYATQTVCRALPQEIISGVLPLRGTTDVCGIRVTTGRNGHAPGGVWLHLDVGAGLLYMGDYSVESALYAHDAPPPAATVILDASYGDYDTPLTDQAAQFGRLFDAGPVLLPVPEGGRGPEIALHVARSGRPLPHIDDAMRGALGRLATADRDCLHPGVAEALVHLADAAPPIADARGIMLASRADATAGDAARLVERWERETEPAIVFTGYIPPGTPAERLTQSGRASYLRWNVHPRLSHNIALVHATSARTVVPAFGDHKHADAWREAFAPARLSLNESVAL